MEQSLIAKNKLFLTKYSDYELKLIEQYVSHYHVTDNISQFTSSESQEKCIKYLGADNKIMLTNIQQIMNKLQDQAGKIVVFDT